MTTPPPRPQFALYWRLLVLAGAASTVLVALERGAVGGIIALFAVPFLLLFEVLEQVRLRAYVRSEYPEWWVPYDVRNRPGGPQPPGMWRIGAFDVFLGSEAVESDPHLSEMRSYYRHVGILIAATVIGLLRASAAGRRVRRRVTSPNPRIQADGAPLVVE